MREGLRSVVVSGGSDEISHRQWCDWLVLAVTGQMTECNNNDKFRERTRRNSATQYGAKAVTLSPCCVLTLSSHRVGTCVFVPLYCNFSLPSLSLPPCLSSLFAQHLLPPKLGHSSSICSTGQLLCHHVTCHPPGPPPIISMVMALR